MNQTDLAERVRAIASSRRIAIDEGETLFGLLPSERIAGFLLQDIVLSNDHTNTKRIMAQVDALIDKESIGIELKTRKARGEDDAEIPIENLAVQDLNAIRQALVDGLYNLIKQDIFNLPDMEVRDYIKRGGRLYDNPPLWEKARTHVESSIGQNKAINKIFRQKQKNAVTYIWDFIPKNADGKPDGGKTNALAFIYDVLLAGGLIDETEAAISRTDEEKRQYIKNYLSKN